MERDAHYAAVGMATVAIVAALAVFVIWLARFQFAEEYDLYDIVFYGPVRGLQEGGEVHFNGIRVGEVSDLNLDPNQPDQVIARVRLEGDTPIRVSSRAQLEPQGITGLNYIQITAGEAESALLKAQYDDNVVPVIQSQPSPIAELLQGGGTVLAEAVDALNRINRVLSDDNIRSFSTSLNNIEEITTELEARRGMLRELEEALAGANRAIAEYEALGAEARQLVQGDGARAIASIERAAAQAEEAMSTLNETTEGIQGPVSDFATNGLPRFANAIQSLEEAADSLDRLVDDVRASPRDFIGRPEAIELEVEQ